MNDERKDVSVDIQQWNHLKKVVAVEMVLNPHTSVNELTRTLVELVYHSDSLSDAGHPGHAVWDVLAATVERAVAETTAADLAAARARRAAAAKESSNRVVLGHTASGDEVVAVIYLLD